MNHSGVKFDSFDGTKTYRVGDKMSLKSKFSFEAFATGLALKRLLLQINEDSQMIIGFTLVYRCEQSLKNYDRNRYKNRNRMHVQMVGLEIAWYAESR